MSVKNLLSVTFRAMTYGNPRKGFSFPQELYDAFGFRGGNKVALIITDAAGRILFCGVSKFISGPEVTEAVVVKTLRHHQNIRVTASRVA